MANCNPLKLICQQPLKNCCQWFGATVLLGVVQQNAVAENTVLSVTTYVVTVKASIAPTQQSQILRRRILQMTSSDVYRAKP